MQCSPPDAMHTYVVFKNSAQQRPKAEVRLRGRSKLDKRHIIAYLYVLSAWSK